MAFDSTQEKQTLLYMLADGKFHSGQQLGNTLNISRTAVWKKINVLQKKYGLVINSLTGKGYQLANPIEFIQPQQVASQLTNAQEIKLYSFLDLPSTNQWLLERYSSNTPGQSIHKTVCHAEFQSQGRGRRAKQWLSPMACNLYFSLGWCFDLPPAALSHLSLLAGVALIKALEATGIQNAGLKWPNDIYLDDKKLAGILIELRGEATGPTTAVIGAGINITMPQYIGDNIEQPWTDISQHCDKLPSRNTLLAQCINEFMTLLSDYQNFTQHELTRMWQNYDILQGRHIMIKQTLDNEQEKAVYGIAKGIHDDGSLTVDINGTIQHLHAGDVSLKLG